MALLSLQQDRPALWADFGFYGLVVAVLAGLSLYWLPPLHRLQGLAWVWAGLGGWTLAEYALHRFVLHGLQPFKRWHALHHARPVELIATPTALTAVLFAGLMAAPAAWLLPPWRAAALGLGVMLGYLLYIITHHAVHHVRDGGAWLRRRQRWHAQHHRAGSLACYGVSMPLWDHILRSAQPQVPQRTDAVPAAR